MNITLYDLRRDVTFQAAATDGQMIARFLAYGASRKQQTTLKIQIKQEICVLSICVSVIYRLVL